nr:translin [Ipomoea batatas]GMC90486.1 translin [Ipomoea batatas]
MKSVYRNAISLLSRTALNPKPTFPPIPTLIPARNFSVPLCNVPLSVSYCTSMAGGDLDAPLSHSSEKLEKQFDEFRKNLLDSSSLRDRIRAVAMEMESTSRLIHSTLLLVHQSRPVPEVLEKANVHIGVLKELYSKLLEVLRECPGQYYRYHGDWRSETQTVVSLLAYMHWLEKGTLLLHSEVEEKLGLNPSDFGLDTEDYLIGICFMSNELPRYVVNRVTAGDYDCPRQVLKFMTDLHAAFRMLNLRNDFLRKKFDGIKYDLRKVEEVYYDVKIRGLATNANSKESEEAA